MKPKPYRDVLDNALRKQIPENVDLLPQIAARYTQGQSSIKKGKKYSLGIALVLLAFAASLAIWPETAVALRRLLGYIPGLGFVEPGNSLRVLAGPVVMEREGVTVTVEKGTADAQRTILRVSVDGANADGGPYCDAPGPVLRLKDGTLLKQTYEAGNIGGGVVGSGYTNLLVFPVLPTGSDDVTLEIPCLWQVVKPENWEIPLHFVAADESELNPVIEFPPVTSTAQQPNESPYGISLALDKVILLENGYLLMGNMSWSNANVQVSPSLSAVDANGREIALEDPGDAGAIPDLFTPQEEGSLRVAWSYKISGKEHAWPLTLKMEADVTYPADVSFTFDPGPNPKQGMKWNLDQALTVNGHPIRLVSATWMGDIPGTALLIEMQSADTDVTNLHVTDKEYFSVDRMCGGGGGGGFEPGIITSVVVYCEPLTPEPRTLTIDAISLRIHGPWQIDWQP